MSNVTVRPLDDKTFEVTVSGSAATTTHTVTVQPDYAERLTGGKVPVEQLVAGSFDFLLQREPNTSILRRFDLPIIGHYFPDYERTMRARFGWP